MNNEVKYLPITSVLEEIIDNRGKSVPTSNHGFPLIATNCIKHSSIYPTFEKVRYVNEHTLKTWFRAHIKPNDILFVNKGTPGRVCLVPNPVTFCAAQDMMAFRCNPEIVDYRYLFAVLRSNEIQKKIENNHVGLVIPHMRKQDLPSLLIPIIGLKEQETIGSIYITLSEKIELNNRINAELEAMAKTLYDYWFVQFDFPDKDGKPYITNGGKMVWNEGLKREIPEGWEVKDLTDITSTIMRGISPNYLETGGICVLNQKCIRDKSINFEPSRRHDNDLRDASLKLIELGDILVNSTGFGTLGRVAIVKRLPEPITTVDSHITIVRYNKKNIKMLFLGYSMLGKQLEIEGLAEGSTGQTELSRVNLGKLKLVIPPLELQSTFENFVNPLILKIANNETENQQLSSLRDWLLPMLMNGQVKVGAKERVIYPMDEMRVAAEPEATV